MECLIYERAHAAAGTPPALPVPADAVGSLLMQLLQVRHESVALQPELEVWAARGTRAGCLGGPFLKPRFEGGAMGHIISSRHSSCAFSCTSRKVLVIIAISSRTSSVMHVIANMRWKYVKSAMATQWPAGRQGSDFPAVRRVVQCLCSQMWAR